MKISHACTRARMHTHTQVEHKGNKSNLASIFILFMLVFWDYHNKLSKIEYLRTMKVYSLTLWKSEVWGQDVAMDVLTLVTLEENLFFTFSASAGFRLPLAYGHITSPSASVVMLLSVPFPSSSLYISKFPFMRRHVSPFWAHVHL